MEDAPPENFLSPIVPTVVKLTFVWFSSKPPLLEKVSDKQKKANKKLENIIGSLILWHNMKLGIYDIMRETK